MRRSELEHVIRASSAVAEDNEIIAIGSQAILGQFPDAPDELLRSNEVDATLPIANDRRDALVQRVWALVARVW